MNRRIRIFMIDKKKYWTNGFLLTIFMGVLFIVHVIIRPTCLRNGLSLETADFIRTLYDSITMFIAALAIFFIDPGPHDNENSKIYAIITSIFIFISAIYTFINALKFL